MQFLPKSLRYLCIKQYDLLFSFSLPRSLWPESLAARNITAFQLLWVSFRCSAWQNIGPNIKVSRFQWRELKISVSNE